MDRRFFFCLTVFCVLAACSRRRTLPLAIPPEPDRGMTSVEVLSESSTRLVDTPQGWEYEPVRFLDAPTLPVYPERALRARAGNASVGVRIVVGKDGKVDSISESPKIVSTPGPFAHEFRAAVEEVVRHWEFVPAEWQRIEDGGDLNGDGKPDFRRVVEWVPVSVYFDIRFDFEMISGKARSQGRVRDQTVQE